MRFSTLLRAVADYSTRSASERSSQERGARPTRIDMRALACLGASVDR